MSPKGGPAIQCADYPLKYYADGYPKLPECLRRTLEEVRFEPCCLMQNRKNRAVQRDKNLDVPETSHAQLTL